MEVEKTILSSTSLPEKIKKPNELLLLLSHLDVDEMEANEYFEILKKQKLLTKEAIQSLKDDTWKDLSLPLGVWNVLRKWASISSKSHFQDIYTANDYVKQQEKEKNLQDEDLLTLETLQSFNIPGMDIPSTFLTLVNNALFTKEAIQTASTRTWDKCGLPGAVEDALHQWASSKPIPFDSAFYTSQMNYFNNLNALYQSWKQDKTNFKPQFIHLPDLSRTFYPKELPQVKDIPFLVREPIFSTFEELEDLLQRPTSFPYGSYISGPLGVGKSVALYTIACLSFYQKYITIYTPRCDEWSSRATEESKCLYILNQIYQCLQISSMFTDQNLQELINIVKLGINSKDQKKIILQLGMFFEVLSNWKSHVLWIIDEVNGIWDQNLQNTSFFQYACHLNKYTMEKGIKLISGTGHSRFTLHIEDGLQKYIRSYKPWNRDEFEILLKSNACHPYLLEVLQKTNFQSSFIDQICRTLGNIPRQLRVLNKCTDKMKDSPILNLVKRLNEILTQYETITSIEFASLHRHYIGTLSQPKKDIHINNLVQIFLGETGITVDAEYLDLSLMYPIDTQKYLPINPSAAKALIANLRLFYKFDADNDTRTVLYGQTNDEKSRAFERLFAKKIFLETSNKMKNSKLDGTDEREENINCNYVALIPEKQLFPDSLSYISPTLLVPQNASYPIADFLLIDPHKQRVILLQLSSKHPTAKIPNRHVTSQQPNPYCAFFDTAKWKGLLKNHFKSHPNPRNNYAEELLSLLGLDYRVTLNGAQLMETDPNTNITLPASHIEYLVVTPRYLDSDAKNLVSHYPWIRVIHGQYLQEIFSQEFVNSFKGAYP